MVFIGEDKYSLVMEYLFERDYFIFIFIGIILIFLVLSYYFNTKNRILRELRNSKPITSLNSVKDNDYVHLKGKALKFKDILNSPFRGKECFLYEIKVEQKNKNWRTIINDLVFQSFCIDINGQKVIINAKTPAKQRRIYLDKDKKGSSSFFTNADNRFVSYMRSKGKDTKSIFGFNKTLRYKEGIISANEMVSVKGIARWVDVETDKSNYGSERILTLTGTKDKRLLITDLKKI